MNIRDKEILVEELEEHLSQVRSCTPYNPFLNLFNDPGVVRMFHVKSKILFDIIDGHDYFHYHAPLIVIEATLEGIMRDAWHLR
jgi:hypothetical protein